MKNLKLATCLLLAFLLVFSTMGSASALTISGIEYTSTDVYIDEETHNLVVEGYFSNVAAVTIKGISDFSLRVLDKNKEIVAEDSFPDKKLEAITLAPGEIAKWAFHFDYFDIIDKDFESYNYEYEFSYMYLPTPQDNSVKIFYNGKKLNLDVPARIVNGRTLVPVRGVIEQLGAKVSYDAKNQKVSINNGEIILTIGSKTALVNGKQVTLDVAPTVINNRTLVPLRFISENIDCNVHWGSNAKVISIVNLQ